MSPSGVGVVASAGRFVQQSPSVASLKVATAKPAGVACVQLDGAGRCRIFGRPERPDVCRSLQPSAEMCGDSRAHAMHWLARLEAATAPAAQPLAAGASAAPGPAAPA